MSETRENQSKFWHISLNPNKTKTPITAVKAIMILKVNLDEDIGMKLFEVKNVGALIL